MSSPLKDILKMTVEIYEMEDFTPICYRKII